MLLRLLRKFFSLILLCISRNEEPEIFKNQRPRQQRSRGVMACCLAMFRILENIPGLGHLVAAGYLAAGSKDKAERAALKATAGIACCFCNLPVDVVDEMTAKPSLKLDSPGLMDRRKWMKRHHRKQLRNICLPGSHQSGTYHMSKKLNRIPMSEGWARCQKLSVEEQLCGGIRFFDFRIMTQDEQVWLHHNVVICRKLKDVLLQIKDFVTDNPSEIVFMHLDRDGKDVNWAQVQDFIHEYFGDKLVMEHMKDMVIGDIVDQGRNIVISGVPNASYSWRSIRHHWPNKPWPEQLRGDMEALITDLSLIPAHETLFWYKAECTPDAAMVMRNIGGVPGAWAKRKRGGQERFEFIEDMAAAVNQVVYEVIQPLDRIPFQVLSTDFVQDDIVGHIVQLNDSASEGVFTAEETLDATMDDAFSETSSLVNPKAAGRNQSVSNISVTTNRSNMNTSFDIRLKAAPPVEIKETNM